MREHVENFLKVHMEYWPSQVVLTAVELNLFAKLGGDSFTAEQLGDLLGLSHPRGTYDFFDALVALRFIERDGDGPDGRYKNIPGMRALLNKDTAVMFKGYELWAALGKALKTGQALTMPGEHQAQPGSDKKPLYEDLYFADDAQEFFHAMDSLQEKNFTQLAAQFDFSRYGTMSDIGCASGLLSMIVAKRHTHLKITNFDLPSVVPFVREQLAQDGLTDRVSVMAGNFFEDAFHPADVITMGNILHNWGLEKKKTLIKKAHDALPEGGALVVVENFIDDGRRSNTAALLMSLNMLIEFGEGFSFSVRDFQSWCSAAGFKGFEVIGLAGASSAAIAYK